MSAPPESSREEMEAGSLDRPPEVAPDREGQQTPALPAPADVARDPGVAAPGSVDKAAEVNPSQQGANGLSPGPGAEEFSAEEMLAWAVAPGASDQRPLPAKEPAAVDAASADPAGFEHGLRLAEALIFASDRPVPPARIQQVLPEGLSAQAVLTALIARSADRPVQCVEVAGGYAFRTAPELAPALTRVVEVPRRLPRVAMETLAIIAYHQPVTRAEIEEIRGASLSQQTLEALLEMGLVAPRGRKEVPGRPSLWATTPRFLEQFGLKALTDLPRREELVNEPGPLLRAVAPAEAGAAPATTAEAPPADNDTIEAA